MATKKKQRRSEAEPVRESAHRIWLAGLGALATVEEQGEKLFKELVARGESYGGSVREPVKTARGRVRETVQSVRSGATRTAERLEGALDDRIQGVLHRIGVPSRDEIAELTARVERLARSVEGAASGRKTTKKKAASKKRASSKKKVAKKTASGKKASKKAGSKA